MAKKNASTDESKLTRKGGTKFPRYSVEHLEPLLKDLVSKTHTNSITIAQLNAGVFKVGSNSDKGKIKSSALKQFKLLSGDYKAFNATELASQIVLSEGTQKTAALQTAFFNVSVFKNTYETYKGGSTTDKQKIGNYASQTLKIHPDLRDEFVKIFSESAKEAKLCTDNGTTLDFNLPVSANTDLPSIEEEESTTHAEEHDASNGASVNDESPQPTHISRKSGPISNVSINIDIDPSMDPEKLEKQLKLLKAYGVI